MNAVWKIGVIVGSNRRESINRKLARAILRLDAPTLAFEDIRIDDLPIYNGDLEDARPEVVNRFTAAVAGCDGLLVVTPEHNRSLTAVLKNAIDWGSKPADKNVWRDKTAMITGTSAGAAGTALAQQHLRTMLGNLGAIVLGGEAYIPFKPDLIDDSGAFAIDSTRAFLQAHLDRFGVLVGKLARR